MTGTIDHAAIHDAVSEQDRRFLEAHPGWKTYIRPPIPHELCPPFSPCVDTRGYWVRVVQLAPGVRTRYLDWRPAA